QDILDILNLGEMPPDDEDHQPEADQVLSIVAQLTETLEEHHELLASTDRQTVLRRLNGREYLNTIRDLLHVDITMFDPTQSFPRDEELHHLDTLGDQLVTSGYLLDRYVEAADEIIEKVFALEEKPEVKTWHFTNNFRGLEGLGDTMEKLCNYEYIALYEVPTSQRHEGAYGTIYDFLSGVPVDGRYRIRFLAEAKDRIHNHIDRVCTTNPEQLLEVALVPGTKRVGELGIPQRIEPTLASFTLPDDDPQWCEATVWMDEGFTPRFIFPNGTINLRSAFAPMFEKISPELGENLENNFGNRKFVTLKYGKLPHIRIHEVEITGPLYDEWPSPAQKALLQGEAFDPANSERLILDFAQRAYRRPVTHQESEELLAFYNKRKTYGLSEFQSFKDTLKRVLCSPGFLYLNEPSNDSGLLDSYALASRLSYFLWSSTPDEALINAAANGDLAEPSRLQRQIKRMLKDPKAEALVKNFVDLVLTLKDLGAQPPDRNGFAIFYRRNLQKYMYEETTRFIRYMLESNRPLSDFIEADYSFINEPLAELYEYEGVKGLDFRKVQIPDPMRAGLLGQASILTVTANGIDTSPVVRGVWMLENILGSPPSPPPPDVPLFEPDTRGSVSMRDQLEKHRKNPTCYDCHRKIDPIGFAFESFDPIGQWRPNYKNKLPVDCSGMLPDGTSFQDVSEFREILLGRRDQIVRGMITKLLGLGTGRRMEPGDRREIDRVAEMLGKEGGGFRSLIELVAASDIFLSP
ncbi:MAG: DUF1592 domain-containing protein, partial [Verrucomicrobiae bacterium]|nr:DUF1592 domain-containing protein [Verrucomicrobiae bacterium]